MTNKSKMDLRQQVGQLMIMGFDGTSISDGLARHVKYASPGGIILFARNLISVDQSQILLNDLQKTATVPMFKCIDLEGGTVDRFKNILAASPSAEEVFSTGRKDLYEKHGALLGMCAFSLGFNTDFAPVSDIGFAVSKPVLTSRTVSAEPEATVTYVKSFLSGLQKLVLGCGKHFPGLGEGNLDSHHQLPVIKKSMAKLWAQDLLPYLKLHEKFPFIMVAHAAYPAVTKDRTPASLSKKWMTNILRKKIGYEGIILADDLEMGGVLTAGSIGEVAVETLAAGADMFLVCHKQEAVEQAYEAVVAEAERSRAFRKLVELKATRVLQKKKRAPQMKLAAPFSNQSRIAALKQTITQFRDEVENARAVRS
jgi:beta-N-acetylhexosaminidase